MELWHNTENTPRLPNKVLEGQRVEIWIASSPIELGQHIKVEWKVTRSNGTTDSGSVPAFWKYNDNSLSQSYWVAKLDPFLKNDRVEYAIIGMLYDEMLSPQVFVLNVE